MTITKDGDALIFIDDKTIHKYDIKSNQWVQEYTMSWTHFPFSGGAVTDLDTGLIYGIDSLDGIGESPELDLDTNMSWKFTEFNPVDKSFTFVEKRGRPGSMMFVSMVYSSAAKRIFGYEDGVFDNDQTGLWSYDIKSKDWTQVKVTGQIPPTRSSPCFVSAYGGQKLILAGGQHTKKTGLFQDIYSFDVSTLAWTKLPDMPLAVLGQSCAVSVDSFIYLGGYKQASAIGKELANDDGPIVLNLASNTW
ncbi:hypothetical protein BGZ65_012351, partial [Modicella reniformis]